MDHQRTIRKKVTLDGIGLHSGKPVQLTLSPAPADSGIVFRICAPGMSEPLSEPIPAGPESVIDSHYATTLGRGGVRVQTVEHLMAATAALGIDNLDVRLDGTEVPAMDGSAKPFVALLLSAGRVRLNARHRAIEIPYPIRVGGESRWLQIVPADRLRISYTLDNTIGVGDGGILNGLRYRDEFVRHKVLDLVGDLALLGRPVLGHVIARNAGHALNFELVVAIQRALGLERRPAAVPVLHPVAADERLATAPAPAAI
jgi:UDP-3-O-[3-hydroxymyristoyl] N-acetylglucosamine deacetylase